MYNGTGLTSINNINVVCSGERGLNAPLREKHHSIKQL